MLRDFFQYIAFVFKFLLAMFTVLALLPVAFMWAWNSLVVGAIDGIGSVDYVEAAVATFLLLVLACR